MSASTLSPPSAAASRPIPIGRAAAAAVGASVEDEQRRALLAAAARAPVIGSLPAPPLLESLLPALDLPPASPDSVSLAAILTAETTRRLVGVSSAPVRSFIENARRST